MENELTFEVSTNWKSAKVIRGHFICAYFKKERIWKLSYLVTNLSAEELRLIADKLDELNSKENED